MAYKRKYRPGEVIKTFDELTEQTFVYWRGKIYHISWIFSWQFRVIILCVRQGSFRKAIRMEETT